MLLFKKTASKVEETMPLETLTVGKLSVCSLTDDNSFTLHKMWHKTHIKVRIFQLDEDVFLEMVIFMLACSSKEKKHPSW